MSLLEEIRKKREKLHHCKTLVTLHSGQVVEEIHLTDGNIIHVPCGSSTGYVIDTKPDLQIAQILPGLFLGSQDVVQDPYLMDCNAVTHVLSVGVNPRHCHSNICFKFVELLDLPESDLQVAIGECLPFIDEVRQKGGNIYVHCNAGVSRSVSIVIAYLIKQGMSFEEAYRLVKSKREVIRPNAGFIQQLKQYEAIQRSI